MRQLLCVISLIRVLVSASHKQDKEFRSGATDTKEHLLQMLVEENADAVSKTCNPDRCCLFLQHFLILGGFRQNNNTQPALERKDSLP